MLAFARLPAAPVPPPPMIGSVYASSVTDAATGFLAAVTSLRGGVRIFPMFAAVPPPDWRSRATSSIQTAWGWRHRHPDAAAVRLGGRGRLAVLEADDADALAAFETQFGPLPQSTIQSVSTRGCLRFWMRLDRDDVRTLHDVTPGVRLYAGGAWMKLPPAGSWVAGLAPGKADYEPIPPGLLREIMGGGEPIPNVRRF